MKKTRKGFTIVELVIVIAVIAILAAVLIPTFSNVIKKANQSADTQLVRMLNEDLAIEDAGNGYAGYDTAYDAIQAVKDYGFDVSKIVAKSSLKIAFYNGEKSDIKDKFVLLNAEDGKYVYPVADGTTSGTVEDATNFFMICNNVNEATVNGHKYSVYAGINWGTADVAVEGVGFDAGEATITSVNYTNTTGNAQNVVIRTNNKDAEIVVNAPSDTVKHYGVAKSVEIQAVSSASYYEYGTLKLADVKNGRIVITNEEEASVGTIYLTATDNAYDDIIIATMNGAELPTVVQRDAVSETDGKVICTIQTNVSDEGKNPEKTEVITIKGENKVTNASGDYSNASNLAELLFEAPAGTTGAGAEYIGNDTSVAEGEKEATLEAATIFAGGKGTKDNPWLIDSYDTFQKISTMS